MDLQNSCLAKCFDLVVPIFCMGKMLHFFKSFEGRFDQGLFEILIYLKAGLTEEILKFSSYIMDISFLELFPPLSLVEHVTREISNLQHIFLPHLFPPHLFPGEFP